MGDQVDNSSTAKLPFLQVGVKYVEGEQTTNIFALKDSGASFSFIDGSLVYLLGSPQFNCAVKKPVTNMDLVGVQGHKARILYQVELCLTFVDRKVKEGFFTFKHLFYVTPPLTLSYKMIIGADLLQDDSFKINETNHIMEIQIPAGKEKKPTSTKRLEVNIHYFPCMTPLHVKEEVQLDPEETKLVEVEYNKHLARQTNYIVTPYQETITIIAKEEARKQQYILVKNISPDPVTLGIDYPIGFTAISKATSKLKSLYSLDVANTQTQIERLRNITDISEDDNRFVDIDKDIEEFQEQGVDCDDIKTTQKTPEEIVKEFDLSHLSCKTQRELQRLIIKYHNLFQQEKFLKPLPGEPCTLEIKMPTAIAKFRPFPTYLKQLTTEFLNDMEEKGIIEEASGHVKYASNVFLIKKDKTIDPQFPYPTTLANARMIHDMRLQNYGMVKCANHIGDVQNILHMVLDAGEHITIFDISQFFHLVPLKKESRPITAFYAPVAGRLMQYTRLPMGCCLSPQLACNYLSKILQPVSEHIINFIDDLVVWSRNRAEHFEVLERVFQIFQKAGVKLKVKKCQFLPRKVKILGYEVRPGYAQMSIPQMKVDALKNIQAPTKRKAVKQLLGCLQYYTRFIPKFSHIMTPILRLLRKTERFAWGKPQDEALKKVKEALLEHVAVCYPDVTKGPIIIKIQTDASRSAACSQAIFEQRGEVFLLGNHSRMFNPSQIHQTSYRKELIAIIHALTKWKPFMEMAEKVYVFTDCRALIGLATMKDADSYMSRIAMGLSMFTNLYMIHVPGKTLEVDKWTRLPTVTQANFDMFMKNKRIKNWEVNKLLEYLVFPKLPDGYYFIFTPEHIRELLERPPIPSSGLKDETKILENKNLIQVSNITVRDSTHDLIAFSEMTDLDTSISFRLEQNLFSPFHMYNNFLGELNAVTRSQTQQQEQQKQQEEIVPSTETKPTRKRKHDDLKQKIQQGDQLEQDVIIERNNTGLAVTVARGFMPVGKFKDYQVNDTFCKSMLTKCAGKTNSEFKQNKQLFKIRKGILFAEDKTGTRVVLPEFIAIAMIRSFHGPSVHDAHPGPLNLQRIIEQKYYYPGLVRTIKEVYENCVYCRMCRPYQYKTPVYENIRPTKPREMVSVDYIPGMPSFKGSTTIMVIVDCFTGFATAFPVASRGADDFIYHLSYNWISVQTPMTYLRVDNEAAFLTTQVQTFLDSFGIEMLPIGPFRSQSNSQVELVVKKIKTQLAIKHMVQEPQLELCFSWGKFLPQIMLDINMTVGTYKFSPFYLQTGQQKALKYDPIVLKTHDGKYEVMINHTEAELKKAWLNLSKARRAKADYDRKMAKGREPRFVVGDYCLVKATHIHQKKAGLPRYVGFYIITDIPHPGRFHLKKLGSDTHIVRDGTQLRLWPQSIANLILPSKWDDHLQKLLHDQSD